MAQNSSRVAGRHFLQIPGPTPVPDRILRAMDTPIIDHRGPEFQKLAKRVLEGIKTIFKTTNPVIIYTATGTGAWEAALVNTLSRRRPRADGRDRPVRARCGRRWPRSSASSRNSSRPTGASAPIRRRSKRSCAKTRTKRSRRSASCTTRPRPAALSPIPEIRKAIDAAGHPALLLVDTISSLASTEYQHDEWGVDVTVGGAQKGLMLPPGMSFNAISDKALAASKTSKLPKSFFAWDDMLNMNKIGFFPYTPATQMLQGLDDRRSTCCTRKASTTCSRATTGSPKRRAAR